MTETSATHILAAIRKASQVAIRDAEIYTRTMASRAGQTEARERFDAWSQFREFVDSHPADEDQTLAEICDYLIRRTDEAQGLRREVWYSIIEFTDMLFIRASMGQRIHKLASLRGIMLPRPSVSLG